MVINVDRCHFLKDANDLYLFITFVAFTFTNSVTNNRFTFTTSISLNNWINAFQYFNDTDIFKRYSRNVNNLTSPTLIHLQKLNRTRIKNVIWYGIIDSNYSYIPFKKLIDTANFRKK